MWRITSLWPADAQPAIVFHSSLEPTLALICLDVVPLMVNLLHGRNPGAGSIFVLPGDSKPAMQSKTKNPI